MLLRKLFPMWFCVGVFVVSIAMMPVVSRLRRQSDEPPHTLLALKARLSQCTPPLYTVWYFENRPESGMWVCVRPRSQEQLPLLVRDTQRADQWEGIVFCERVREHFSIPEEFIRDYWGEYGMRIGPFVLFGDPELLRRIRKAILEEPGA